MLYKEGKEWDAQPNNDDRVNDENGDMDKKQRIVVNYGKITKIKNISQKQNCRLYYNFF